MRRSPLRAKRSLVPILLMLVRTSPRHRNMTANGFPGRTAEAFPLAKTSRLADVSGASPNALAALGLEVALVRPGYPPALRAVEGKANRTRYPGPIWEVPACSSASSGGLTGRLVDCLFLDESGRSVRISMAMRQVRTFLRYRRPLGIWRWGLSRRCRACQ